MGLMTNYEPSEGWKPEYEKEPGLEAPAFSYEDLIGSGLLKLVASGAVSLGSLLAMMKMGGGANHGSNSKSMFQTGAINPKWPIKDPDGDSKFFDDKVGNASVSYNVIPRYGEVDIGVLKVPASKRGHGEASAAMREILNKADAEGYVATLLASPLDSKTKLSRLVEFYKSYGFEPTGQTNAVGEPFMVRKK